MRPENVIEVRNVQKTFRVYCDKSHLLKEKAIHWDRNRYEEHQVLKDISFDIRRGEAVGLIGQNGCGKSTLLKLMTKIIYPESGTIMMDGRISSLLELGAGFHPDLSGRENIYINASTFGMTGKETERRIDAIISFAELEEVIDHPVRTYSSGMYMRLAFSVAIHMDADILLIDEILAVGDIHFQEKCLDKLLEIKRAGTTIVMVSHAAAQIEQICDRSIWIHDGCIREQGVPAQVQADYQNYLEEVKNERSGKETGGGVQEGAQPFGKTHMLNLFPEQIRIYDQSGKKRDRFRTGEAICLEAKVYVKPEESLTAGTLEINLIRSDGIFCCGVSAPLAELIHMDQSETTTVAVCLLDVNLLDGMYHIDWNVSDANGKSIAFAGNIVGFQMESDQSERGLVCLNYKWMHIKQNKRMDDTYVQDQQDD